MGILSRFRDIMRANVNSFLDRAEDPAKAMNEYMRSLHSDLGQVKAETNSVLADERRAKASLDECQAEIKKLQRYAEKAVEAGNEDDAVKFLERKAERADKLNELQKAYEQASAKVASMKQMQEKLMSDLGQLEARNAELQEKLTAAKLQQGSISGNSSPGNNNSSFDEMEEKAYLAMEEAIALAELRAGTSQNDPADTAAKLEHWKQEAFAKSSVNSSVNSSTSTPTSIEDELSAIKEKMNKKES